MDGGWFVFRGQVSWCSILAVFNTSYTVRWQGKDIGMSKDSRFPTMLAAQLNNNRNRTECEIDAHRKCRLFFEELSRKFEDEAELTDKAWFVEWNKFDYRIGRFKWRALSDTLCCVWDNGEWRRELIYVSLRFKTEAGAVFYAEAEALSRRVNQEERLCGHLKRFGGGYIGEDDETEEE